MKDLESILNAFEVYIAFIAGMFIFCRGFMITDFDNPNEFLLYSLTTTAAGIFTGFFYRLDTKTPTKKEEYPVSLFPKF